MIKIRRGTFETNSSSVHAFSFERMPENINRYEPLLDRLIEEKIFKVIGFKDIETHIYIKTIDTYDTEWVISNEPLSFNVKWQMFCAEAFHEIKYGEYDRDDFPKFIDATGSERMCYQSDIFMTILRNIYTDKIKYDSPLLKLFIEETKTGRMINSLIEACIKKYDIDKNELYIWFRGHINTKDDFYRDLMEKWCNFTKRLIKAEDMKDYFGPKHPRYNDDEDMYYEDDSYNFDNFYYNWPEFLLDDKAIRTIVDECSYIEL